MANDDTPAGFLSRWSRRKVQVREGRTPPEPLLVAVETEHDAQPSMANSSPVGPANVHANVPDAKHIPTLDDAQKLTPESDFTGFMARDVTPEVKNAAMKKLFTDPHFNVMDGMDVYIDDYSQPDPLPLAMLRQMTSAKALNLFDESLEQTLHAHLGDKPEAEEPKVVAQSVSAENNSNTEPTTHDHADLRLQPDPTPRPQGAEPKPI